MAQPVVGTTCTNDDLVPLLRDCICLAGNSFFMYLNGVIGWLLLAGSVMLLLIVLLVVAGADSGSGAVRR